MFDSVSTIFNHYLDEVTRYNIYSIEMRRGENPEDLYYLCNIKNRWFVVYETDYIGELTHVVKEIESAFQDYDVKSLHWVAKKEMLREAKDGRDGKETFVVKLHNTHLRFALLEVEAARSTSPQYNPTTYGNINPV